MEYDKINNLLLSKDNESEQLSKCVTREYVRVNSLSNTYNENKSIRFKTPMWCISGDAVFIINDTKMYIPVVTLSKEDKDFIEQQNKGFQRSIYWNEYKTKETNEDANANVFKYINLDPSFQGVNRLFVMAYNRGND